MNEWQKYKPFFPFIGIVALFFASVTTIGIVLLKWDAPVKEEKVVEVSLPVLNWHTYTSLSKQLKK